MKILAIIFAVTFVFTATAVDASEAPCPERYATSQELEACLNDDSCALKKKFPAEMKRRDWALQAAKLFILETLGREKNCVLMEKLVEDFAASTLNCHLDEGFNSVAAMLYRMSKREKTILASSRRDRPGTSYTLVDKGTCR